MNNSILSKEDLDYLLEIRHSLEKMKTNLQPGFDKFKLQEVINILLGIEANHERIG